MSEREGFEGRKRGFRQLQGHTAFYVLCPDCSFLMEFVNETISSIDICSVLDTSGAERRIAGSSSLPSACRVNHVIISKLE